jgi:hypothetical protein
MAKNPNPSALDQDQIIRRVFDGANDKLRVDATLSLDPGTIKLTDNDDSVAIGNGSGVHATITPILTKNAIDVNVANDVNLIIDSANDSIAIENAAGVPLTINADGSILSSDISNSGGVNGAISVGLAAVEAKVGATVLSSRKELAIYHNGTGVLCWGVTSGVTLANGIPIYKNTMLSVTAGPNTHIWLIADTAAQDIRLVELA